MPSNRSLIILLLIVVGMLFMVLAVSADPVTIAATGIVNTGQITNMRISRTGTPSSCGGKVFPGTITGSTYAYTVEGPFGPVAQDGCVTVNWSTSDPQCDGGPTFNLLPVVFLNGFDPAWGASNAANYLGDPGTDDIRTYSFPVSAGDNFVLVFENTGSPEACNYSYTFTYDKQTSDICVDVPEGSVVGNTPYNAQVYYEPGNVSPGIFLNPGNYIVIGQDETETYYKIVLACQYVWVLKTDFQPSFEPPQNGAPLPTTIVS